MSPMAAISSVAKQAEQLRQDGNNCFKKSRFGAAIDAYTEAITLCPNIRVYWTNRALCHMKKNNWDRVMEDCRKAVQLDNSSVKNCQVDFVLLVLSKSLEGLAEDGELHFGTWDECNKVGLSTYQLTCLVVQANKSWVPPKSPVMISSLSPEAHYMLGLALIQKQDYSDGVKELEKALDLGRGANPKGYMVEEIWQELAKARYLLWEQESSQRSWELQTLKEACQEALKEQHIMDSSKTEGFINEADAGLMKQLDALDLVFRKAGEHDIPSEVPDYLCCRITLDIFRDPVITPSGVTYERAIILEHLEKMGKFDPITREPLDQSQLIPNLAIKEAVQAYLEDHGWAYKTD
uniref:E3 ubiquitin-protein ligase CHIP n=1 Tax=Chenopodium quinoa TaxID=63459 RepID=A0A803KQ70_CHEQI